jgi:hypothetical protein
MSETLICRHCNTEKPISDFPFMKYKNIYRKKCKQCCNAYANANNKTHPERVKQRHELYVKYLAQLQTSKTVADKFNVKNRLYKENVSELMKDQIWEDFYGR